ncbi:MAG: 3-deoxy-manno-octulosonate cytidylyltransferase [Gammaproteobacteria bacterium]|nr:3-deoxy-manno-octulosonate cytidylyltransferase [Gammaproteobacteria bacterium]
MSAQSFKVVIPARFASTRLPGKPLIKILDKPMIEWVYLAAKASQAEQVIIATDDDRIIESVESFGGECCKTRSDHETGTDRIVEVTGLMGWSDDTIIVNLQGDEPLMPAANLTQVASNLVSSGFEMSTLHKSIDAQAAIDPDQVKLVCDANGRALYFSRSSIPYEREYPNVSYSGHIGLYAYRVDFLKIYASLKPCMLEQSEKLEQLRALYYGYNIHTEQAIQMPGIGVDTEQDLRLVTQQLKDLQS